MTQVRWQQWNIDLASVGANLTNVTMLTIGIEGSGSGLLFVDDVRLYREAPSVAEPVDPGTAGLLLEYTFEGNTNDSSDNGYNGTLLGDARVQNGVLVLDGTRDACRSRASWRRCDIQPVSPSQCGCIRRKI